MPFPSLSRKGVPVGGHAPSPGDDEPMSWFCMNSGTVCVECEQGLQHPSRHNPLEIQGPLRLRSIYEYKRFTVAEVSRKCPISDFLDTLPLSGQLSLSVCSF